MPTYEQIKELLDEGHSFETVSRVLDVPPGLAFMIATGTPADVSGAPVWDRETRDRLGRPPQELVNAASFNPTHKPRVLEWVRGRALGGLSGRDPS